MRNRILDDRHAETVAEVLLDALSEAGYPTEEAIPGLIQAVVVLASSNEQILDEAANLLADGGV